jgi:tRNA dimethylallyltransferase
VINKILVVAGPTASGKSALALKLALALDGEIVNADSVQVYRGMDIGSAKMMPSELGSIQQHLVDIAEPDSPIDVADYVRMADIAIKDIVARGKVPIIVGGSSLYLKALLHGLAELPKADPKIRSLLEQRDSDDLYRELSLKDPIRASKLHVNDRVRVIRALESCQDSSFSGQNSIVSAVQVKHSFLDIRYTALIHCLLPPRNLLYDRINQRSLQMIADGLISEVSGLLVKYGPSCRPFNSVGYSQALAQVVATGGDSELLSLGQGNLVDEIAQATRRYAKQQYTFWRNEPSKRGWLEIEPNQGVLELSRCFLEGGALGDPAFVSQANIYINRINIAVRG